MPFYIFNTACASVAQEMEQKLEPYIFEGTVYKVTSANFLPVAISKLLESDPEYIGIDLEWRPDFNSGDNNPIEIIQLATGTYI